MRLSQPDYRTPPRAPRPGMLGHTRLTRAAGPAHKPITAHRASTWHTGIAIETSTVDSACMRARQERPRHHHPTTLHAAAPLVARTCSLCSIAVLLFFSIAPAKQVLFRHLIVGRGLCSRGSCAFCFRACSLSKVPGISLGRFKQKKGEPCMRVSHHQPFSSPGWDGGGCPGPSHNSHWSASANEHASQP